MTELNSRQSTSTPPPAPLEGDPLAETGLPGGNGTDGHQRSDPPHLLARATPSHHTADLLDKIRESAEKLANDRASRGDLKILSRTLQELRYAFKVFSPYRGFHKVTVFGSARTPSHHPAYQQAEEFGRRMAEEGWYVVTGAASGIMEAGHVGAGREHSMGLNILLPFEQSANPVIAGDPKLVHMKYFFTRKLMFVKESNAMCCLPGGFGTLDEGIEVLTLLQTGKRDMVPVVFLDEPGGDYWQDFQGFIHKNLLHRGMICPEDLSLYRLTDQVDVAVREILDFYRVYHSMRYVKRRLVLRLRQTPSEETLAGLETHFSDLLAEGDFSVNGPLEEERDEPELAQLPRLVFTFTRHNFGRLRQMINYLNLGVLPPRPTGCEVEPAEM